MIHKSETLGAKSCEPFSVSHVPHLGNNSEEINVQVLNSGIPPGTPDILFLV